MKYRKKLLTDRVSFCVRDMIRESCPQEDIEIIKVDVSRGHIYLFVSIPPQQVAVSRFV
jgi:REP element-mobilizing transposase RayT